MDRGEGYKSGGGTRQFLPLNKMGGGGRTSFSHAERVGRGGTKGFVFTWDPLLLYPCCRGGGHQKFPPF